MDGGLCEHRFRKSLSEGHCGTIWGEMWKLTALWTVVRELAETESSAIVCVEMC